VTTIAYKDGIIAYDSRATNGGTIENDSVIKRVVRDGVNFFMCGAFADYDGFVTAYLSGDKPSKYVDICALVVKGGVVSLAGADKCELWEREAWAVEAIGSGSSFAFGAMDAGCSAKNAVRIAARRDTKTGGRIRTYKI